MKIITSFISVLILMSFSLCMADNASLQSVRLNSEKAYSLYNQGKMKATIQILEDYVKEHPDPRALYFLGYAYYKIKKIDMALKYFNETYLIDSDFSPVAKKGN